MTAHAAAATGRPAEIVLDLSRLVSRIRHATPTGVDRVEMAYARELMRRVPDRLSFGVLHPLGRYGRLPWRVASDFLDRTEADWADGPSGRATASSVRAQADALWRVRPRAVPPARGPRVFLQSSPHHLHRERTTIAILRRERARFVCLLHDLIPLDYPEYARPGGSALHARRMATVARRAAAAIANSQTTRTSFLPHLAAAGRDIEVRAALLGLDPPPADDIPHAAASGRPYFLCVGTIEPRKNHLLLLHVWRRLAETRAPADVPRLVVVGRRGWENEQVVDLLERCPALAGHVEERAGLSDRAVRGLMRGARAVLLPSFAEGFGLPVPEALQLGTPVLCSDLPALREAGGDVPDFLDPLDGPGWLAAVTDYARADSVARAAQIARMGGWRAPTWTRHMDDVLDLIGTLD